MALPLGRALALGALALLALHPARAQEAPADTLGAVLVEAAPFALAPSRSPLALTTRVRTAEEVATDPAVGLDAVLAGLPGVWVSDRESYAQGERLLVRGLGWRAAFGVRGTHVILDGVPLTLADGQTQLNVVDPALVRRAEVVRGPASTFWGSGAGGVVALSTEAPDGAPTVRARALGGGYGLASASVAVRPDVGAGRLAAWGSYLAEDGYRDHSAVRLARAGVSGGAAVGAGEVSVVGLLAVLPRAESPGGITAEAFREDPRQTRPIAVERDASKELVQGHVSVSYARPLGGVRLRATATGGARTLDNPIVPRYIQLDRATAGLRVTAEGGAALAWGLGAEGELQRDDRLETSNDGGRPGPEVLTDQVETVRSGAVFGRLSAPLGRGVTATGALRADVLGYRADPSRGSGQAVAGGAAETRVLGAVSPSVGLAARWRAGALVGTAYANAAGALDAPTTTELGNRPGGLSGFNPDLRPERTWGAELGTRATAPVGGGAVSLDAAVFVAAVRDLLVPFEEGDVTFYRNEGRTRHVGVELGVQPLALPLGPGRLDGAVSYAWTRARFTGSAGDLALDGNSVPGVPEHLATGTLTWTAPPLAGGGFRLVLGASGEAASAYVADSANELAVEGYAVVHLRAALAGLPLGRGATATPFVAVRNVGDARYAGSVVVNAFGGRFVEPGAGRHVQAGVSVALD